MQAYAIFRRGPNPPTERKTFPDVGRWTQKFFVSVTTPRSATTAVVERLHIIQQLQYGLKRCTRLIDMTDHAYFCSSKHYVNIMSIVKCVQPVTPEGSLPNLNRFIELFAVCQQRMNILCIQIMSRPLPPLYYHTALYQRGMDAMVLCSSICPSHTGKTYHHATNIRMIR